MGAELTPVAMGSIDGVDLSGVDVAVQYELVGIPPSDAPYYVTAFLDDNGTVDPGDPASAGPDMGDLVSLDGFGSPSVLVDSVGAVPFDIDLNIAMPF